MSLSRACGWGGALHVITACPAISIIGILSTHPTTHKKTPRRGCMSSTEKTSRVKGGGMSIWGKYQVSTNYLLKWEWCRNVGPSETYWFDYEVSLFRAKVKITTPDIRAYFAVLMLFDYIIYEGYSALLHEVHFQKAGTGIISWKLYQQK